MEKNLFDNMIQDRRKIHMCPEEGWTEFDTTYYIVCRLISNNSNRKANDRPRLRHGQKSSGGA